jgi:RsiW-degrading membrane proteinase PrsW (M82 family)
MDELILIAAAVVPAIFLMVKVYQADRLEKEPIGMLIGLLFLGIISTSLAGTTEELGSIALSNLFPNGGLISDALLYFIVVALSEEGFKYLLLKIRTWKSPHFNCQFDGVVYAVFVSLGFALWENIAYVLRFGFGTAVARAVTAVPGHACFGVFMGVWYGVAKRYELAGHMEESAHARKMALVIPLLLHGVYDFIASMQNDLMSVIFLIFVGWMFRTALKLVRKVSAEDSPLMQIYEPENPERYGPDTDIQYGIQESFKEEEEWR